ncbi:hypothetical protein [Metabacillus litoralis]|jgi:hypothetical protein|uniref:hypothetical protein n=1 Tax=Metabacillus litoralis TaxID=152268 RepID=UPI00203A69C2|nr:hypothetical protein [Metabacillus litoralis]
MKHNLDTILVLGRFQLIILQKMKALSIVFVFIDLFERFRLSEALLQALIKTGENGRNENG